MPGGPLLGFVISHVLFFADGQLFFLVLLLDILEFDGSFLVLMRGDNG